METASKPLPDRNQSGTTELRSSGTGWLCWAPGLLQDRGAGLHLPSMLRGSGDLTESLEINVSLAWLLPPRHLADRMEEKGWQPVRSFHNGQTRQDTPG